MPKAGPKQNDGGRRHAMVERQVLEAIASYLSRDIKNELPGLVTVSRVQLAGDLKSAKVYVSVLAPGQNEEELRDEVVDLLQDFAGEIQHEVDRQLRLRFTPKLKFLPDESTQKILKVESLLQGLRAASPGQTAEGIPNARDDDGGDDE